MSDTSAATIPSPRRQPLDATAPRINPPGRPKPVYADRVKYDAKNHEEDYSDYKRFKRAYIKFQVTSNAELLKQGLTFEPMPFGRAERLWLRTICPPRDIVEAQPPALNIYGEEMHCRGIRYADFAVFWLSDALVSRKCGAVMPTTDDLTSIFPEPNITMEDLKYGEFVRMMCRARDGALGQKLYKVAMSWIWAMMKQLNDPDGPTATENYRAFMEQRILETWYERQMLIEEHMNYVAMGRGRDAGELCYDTYRLAQVRNYQWSRATSECYNLPPPSFYAPNDRLWPRSTPPRGCATESALDDEFALPIELVGAESLTWYCRKVISTGATCEVPPRDDKLIDTLRKAASRRDE